jgi:hypothetical protein
VRRATLRRAAALWVLLFAVYAATIGLKTEPGSDYAGDEPHFLLTTKSIVEDHNADLLDEYRTRDYREIYPRDLRPRGALTKGRLNEPHGLGFPLLIAPAYAIGGPKAVEVFLAAIAALAIVLAYAIALRVVPDPWAIGAALLGGLSPPMLGWATAVYPAVPAGAAMAGAALIALKLTEKRSRPLVFGCFFLIGMLPWLAVPFMLPAAVLAALTTRLLWSQRRRMMAIGGLEVLGFSLAFYAGLNEGFFGGLTPFAAQLPGDTPTGADTITAYAERSYRFVALWIDREYGLLRWAPLFVLAWVGLWFVWREWRGGLARVIPELQAEEFAAALCASVVGAQLIVATFLAPTMFGYWFPGRHLVPALPLMVPLVAIALRRMPRLGAVLGVIGVVASVWLYMDLRWGDATLVARRPNAPWGPLEVIWPDYRPGHAGPDVIAALVAIALAAAFFVDVRVWRRLAGRARVGAGASVLLLAVVVAAALPGSARAERVTVGHSADGRPIVASRLGDPNAPRKALVVGQIHGDEPGGMSVTAAIRRDWGNRLRGVDLWVVDTFNPDGLRHRTRQNARQVDLNRNFPYRWRANGRRGSRYWGGPKPLSEPESRAVSKLVLRLRPAVTVWYHQPWGAVLACGGGPSTAVARRYSQLARLGTSCRGSGLTGTATSWQNNVVGGGSAFVVELRGGRVPQTTARRHARAAVLVAEGR